MVGYGSQSAIQCTYRHQTTAFEWPEYTLTNLAERMSTLGKSSLFPTQTLRRIPCVNPRREVKPSRFALWTWTCRKVLGVVAAFVSPVFERYLYTVPEAARGEEAINSGASRDFGWQSQMVARIRQHGQILTFWQSHSVRAPGEVLSGVVSAQDDAFMNAIQPTIERLRHYWGDSLPEDPKGAIPTFLLDVGIATRIVESYRSLLGATIEVRETLEAEISLLHQVHSNELTSIYNSRTWKTRLGILRVINFLRRRG